MKIIRIRTCGQCPHFCPIDEFKTSPANRHAYFERVEFLGTCRHPAFRKPIEVEFVMDMRTAQKINYNLIVVYYECTTPPINCPLEDESRERKFPYL